MKLRRFVVILAAAIVVLTGSLAAAQSLGELARQQREARQKQTQKPAKVLTNEDVATTKPSEGPTAAAGMSEEPQAPSEETASTPAETANKPAETTESTEQSAAEKMKTRR